MKHFFIFCLMLIAGIRAMAQDYVVYGHVYDAQTGESLIAANVYNPNTLRGTTTNEFGYYSLKMSKDNASICVSYVGYETFSMKLPLAADTMIVVRLVPNRTLKEIVVTDNRPEVGVNSTRMGASTVPLDIIRNMPMMLSEPDVLKTIQALPGVQSGMIGSSGIHVRGGDPDQNLFLLDGMPLYNVSHAFGLVSVFQPEAIKNVDFYKCSFPARFGGRLSSIVDVRTKDGDMKNYYGSFSIGLLTSHINLEGPIVKDRTSFIISARRSYFDWITYPIAKATMDGESLGMSIYDANIKINHKFSDRQRLYLFFYSGRDNIHYKWDGEWYNGGDKEKVKHRWGNTLATIRLNSVVSPRIFHNLTLAYTGYASNLYNYLNEWNKIKDDNGQVINTQEETTESEFKSGINDISLSSDFDFSITPVSHAKFGASVIYHNFHPDVQTSKYKEEGFGEPIDSSFTISPSRMNSSEVNLYAENDFSITKKLKANIGIHASWYHVEGKNYVSAQPRASLSWDLPHHFKLKAAYAWMSQIVHMLSSSELSMPTDLWVPSTKNIEPMHASHYSLGGCYTGIKGWEFTAETYYKYSQNLLEYKEGMGAMGGSTGWQAKVEMGNGESYGIELMAQKTIGKLNGWVNYTLSKTSRWFPDGSINQGRKFPYKYDRHHVVNITLGYDINKRIDIHAEWNFMSGAWCTVPCGYTIAYDPTIQHVSGQNRWTSPIREGQEVLPRYESRNNYELPSSHGLNLGINFHKQKKHGERIWNFSVLNVYNRKNPDIVVMGHDFSDDNNYTLHLQKLSVICVIPSLSYMFKF